MSADEIHKSGTYSQCLALQQIDPRTDSFWRTLCNLSITKDFKNYTAYWKYVTCEICLSVKPKDKKARGSEETPAPTD